MREKCEWLVMSAKCEGPQEGERGHQCFTITNNTQASKGVLRDKMDFKERAWVDALLE